MGLYLCIFTDDEEELDGVEVGSYEDYGHLIETIVRELEGGVPGAKYPLLTLHSDSDGEWTAKECAILAGSLREIGTAFRKRLPEAFKSNWQVEVSRLVGLQCQSLYDNFIDVDGEPLLARLIDLCEKAVTADRPISFQ